MQSMKMSELGTGDMQRLEDLISNINNSAKKAKECNTASEDSEVIENTDKSAENGDRSDDTEDIPQLYDSADELSFDVSKTELEFLNSTGVEVQMDSCRNEDACEEVEEDVERFASVTDSVSSLDVTETLFVQKSKLHCRLCGELYRSPKILNCLHTYCLPCLEYRKKERHRMIFCPVCRVPTKVKEVSSLDSNTVLEKMLNGMNTQKKVDQFCVICKMHDEETDVTHLCKDCGDKLCVDCAEKHTFSRQTAKHTVVKANNGMADIDSGEERQFDNCAKHVNEELKYLCQDCDSAVCRDCVMLRHQNHKCISQTELHSQLYGKLSKNVESLKEMINKYKENLEDEYDKDLNYLLEKEKAEENKLRKMAADVIEIINKKLDKGLEELSEEYRIKRNYCTARKSHIEQNSEKVDKVAEIIEFLLSTGNAAELLPIENKIDSRLKDIKQQIERTFPKLTSLKKLPEIKHVPDNIELLKRLPFFTLHSHRNNNQEDTGKKSQKKGTDEIDKRKIQDGRNLKPKLPEKRSNVGASQPPAFVPSFGRGDSLLGEYPGQPTPLPFGNQKQIQTINRQVPSTQTNLGQQIQCRKEIPFKGGKQQKARNSPGKVGSMISSGLSVDHQNWINLTLQSFINTQMLMDKAEARIIGLTFVEQMNFAVSDTVNNRLKVFALNGKFLDMIQDQAPMSVTSCKNTLIWNADYNKIKIYDAKTHKYNTVKQYRKDKATHPVTSFKHEKYLVFNREKNTVEAFNLSNQLVHCMKPKDKDRQVIQYIDGIAALAEDQVVIIECESNKLYVTDFDGNWIGEYCERIWQPGCAAINQNNDIFVTDMLNNRLVLLDPRGRFKCDWQLQVESPYAVACNFEGDLVLSSNGGLVCHYKYTY